MTNSTSAKTHTGRFFDFANPRAEDIHAKDIIVALSRAPRWTGHTHGDWSVADHSVLCWRMLLHRRPNADAHQQLHVLLHDAHEAYMGDASTPLKNTVPELRALGARIQIVIHEYFGLDEPSASTVAAVVLADAEALDIEWCRFMKGDEPISNLPIVQDVPEHFLHSNRSLFPALLHGLLCEIKP